MLLIIHWHILTLSYPPPASTKLRGGILVSHRPSVCPSIGPSIPLSVSPSVCGQNRFCSVSSTIPVGSISYLHILSSNFRGVLRVRVIAKFWNFWQILEICNFDFVFLWHELWCESLVWVTLGRREVSQNAGVLVVLVFFMIFATSNTDSVASNLMSFLH